MPAGDAELQPFSISSRLLPFDYFQAANVPTRNVRSILVAFFFAMALSVGAAAQSTVSLGESIAALIGPWKFHTGDDPQCDAVTCGAHDSTVGKSLLPISDKQTPIVELLTAFGEEKLSFFVDGSGARLPSSPAMGMNASRAKVTVIIAKPSI